eukprot:COSAG01_NODE_62347_length_285_cov_0.731183_1_plen_62_part_10
MDRKVGNTWRTADEQVARGRGVAVAGACLSATVVNEAPWGSKPLAAAGRSASTAPQYSKRFS